MNKNTLLQFDEISKKCRDIYIAKIKDYGLTWRIMRPSSLTDQIYIKAKRIRSIEEKKKALINEGIEGEYMGILNYCIMALIQLEKGYADTVDMKKEEAIQLYDEKLSVAKALMTNKNHDYDEAWRNMNLSSITDIILVKILRIKTIEKNSGKTTVSEGVDSNYQDIINYSIFALIRLLEKK